MGDNRSVQTTEGKRLSFITGYAHVYSLI